MNGHIVGSKEVSVFRNGRSQAVRIPREFELSAEKVIMTKDEDGTLHLKPVERKLTLLEALDWLKNEGPIDDFPGDPGEQGLLPLDDVKL